VCGIAGCYQQHDGLALAETMNDRIAHRGPDAEGVYRFEDGDGSGAIRAYLAHRRLSIIDLSSGADQPFTKRGLTISYNGELYNYKELRAELARAGVAFRTQSDTEVVLEAWRRWGPAALSRFRGMFAFAMLDEDSGNVIRSASNRCTSCAGTVASSSPPS
jgi:asparagine synthase (glutamine-hydrolysing)